MSDKKRIEIDDELLENVNGGINLTNVTARKVAGKTVMNNNVNTKTSGLVYSGGKAKAGKLGTAEVSLSPEIKALNNMDGPTLV